MLLLSIILSSFTFHCCAAMLIWPSIILSSFTQFYPAMIILPSIILSYFARFYPAMIILPSIILSYFACFYPAMIIIPFHPLLSSHDNLALSNYFFSILRFALSNVQRLIVFSPPFLPLVIHITLSFRFLSFTTSI